MPPTAVESLTPSQILDLHSLYQSQWWARGRSLDDVRTMIEHSSLIAGFVDEHEKLIAFCRVLTDFVFRATICDLIVAESHRGQGIGRKLMEMLDQHPRLQRVDVLWLCCQPEMVPFYERWGFSVFDRGPLWMWKDQREG